MKHTLRLVTDDTAEDTARSLPFPDRRFHAPATNPWALGSIPNAEAALEETQRRLDRLRDMLLGAHQRHDDRPSAA
ncbi:MAG: hypothetical protein HRU70_05825 [Phycisphaeraceae bacterium]|nr:MAG: hypothetical protein HRU70_05825 [Phycisphaeraceae bacterium]